jgi:molybdopterin biosynthesis enzyme
VGRYFQLLGDAFDLTDCVLKTVDTNSAHFAKYCFSLGISLKRIEVIADDEGEIGEAAKRMSENYDFVVTRQATRPL